MLKRLGVVMAVLAATVAFVATVQPSQNVAAASSTFVPIQPDRIFDSRTADTLWPQVRKVGPGETITVFARTAAMSHAPTAVALNVTASKPTASTFLTVWPADVGRPNASNVNAPANVTIANAVVVGVSDETTEIKIFNDQGFVDVIVDVTGYFVGGFIGVKPDRVMDTRQSLGGERFGPGSTQQLKVTDVAGVPSNATAIAVNVTATRAMVRSFVTAWPAGTGRPLSSNLNFGPGPAVPNLVIVGVGSGGRINLYNELGSTDLLVDVLGYFTAASGFQGLTPARILDTRQGTCGAAIGAGEVRVLKVTGRGGVPSSGVGAVVLNVTATRPTSASYLTVWPTGSMPPFTSNLNFTAGQTVPNTVIVGVGQGGQISITNGAGSTDVFIDVMGYFGGSTPAGATVTCPVVPPPTTTTTTTTTTTPPPTTTTTTTTTPPQNVVTPGAFCSPPGATGVSATGVHMTCVFVSCTGTHYGDTPRWRRTVC